jgi:hypothetical protein
MSTTRHPKRSAQLVDVKDSTRAALDRHLPAGPFEQGIVDDDGHLSVGGDQQQDQVGTLSLCRRGQRCNIVVQLKQIARVVLRLDQT